MSLLHTPIRDILDDVLLAAAMIVVIFAFTVAGLKIRDAAHSKPEVRICEVQPMRGGGLVTMCAVQVRP